MELVKSKVPILILDSRLENSPELHSEASAVLEEYFSAKIDRINQEIKNL